MLCMQYTKDKYIDIIHLFLLYQIYNLFYIIYILHISYFVFIVYYKYYIYSISYILYILYSIYVCDIYCLEGLVTYHLILVGEQQHYKAVCPFLSWVPSLVNLALFSGKITPWGKSYSYLTKCLLLNKTQAQRCPVRKQMYVSTFVLPSPLQDICIAHCYHVTV